MAENTNDLPDGSRRLDMEKLVALCKRRGFIFQSSEIYGGINGFWDYGPLGVELKRNIKEAWWQDIVRSRDDMVGLDCSIIMNPKVWEASGHVVNFNDPLVDCKQCKARFRADKVIVVSVLTEQGSKNFIEAAQHLVSGAASEVTAKADSFFRVGVEADSVEAAVKMVPELISKLAKRENIIVLKTAEVEHQSVLPGDKRALLGIKGKNGQPLIGVVEDLAEVAEGNKRPCPLCGGELTDARKFNMMFKTFVGAMEDSTNVAHLRPETAQGIFCNYKNVLDTTRLKVPFGIAQVGKSFRNEINPRNYTFRSREFEQMEIEFFCHPKEADQWYETWRKLRYEWYVGLGLRSSKLRLRDHEKSELAHYARACADIEYEFPFGIAELEGVANRTDFDLKAHQAASGKDMTYFDDDAWEGHIAKRKADGLPDLTKEEKATLSASPDFRFIPYVIEPSGGVDRGALAFLCEAYCEDTAPDDSGKPQARTVMKFHPRLAPIKVAVFPLVKKDGMPEVAAAIHEACKKAGLVSFYDEKGAVGRRYRRQDEAGTPFCVTVDGQTLQDQTVTVRDRDSLKQERIAAEEVAEFVRERIGR